MTAPAPGPRTVIVPDLDRELLATLGQLEELLMMLSGDAGDDNADLADVPEPFADDQALTAVRNLWSALRPTQTPPGSRPGRLYAHIPLVPVQLDRGDLDVLGAAARGLGDPDRGFVLDDALEEGARIGPHSTPVALVEHVARLHGVLDLELNDDARTLLPRLQASLVDDVVLTPAEDEAYRRTVDRINTMWSGDALDRWAY